MTLHLVLGLTHIDVEQTIKILAARQNNLKNLNVEIPLEKLVCITGPSGSGKSSLAFDTLYAEGHRRYVESLSTYARQFFEKLPKPDLDSLENICPSIALQQINPVKNSRSTVGTTTEIYDYLRVLFEKLSEAHCPNGHGIIQSDTPGSAADHLIGLIKENPLRVYIGFFLPEQRSHQSLLEAGFIRRLKSEKNPELVEIELSPKDEAPKASPVVVDRLVVEKSQRARLLESIETCFRLGEGQAFAFLLDEEKFVRFQFDLQCNQCDARVPKRSPLLFSFNSPIGACESCKGFGNILVYDESLLIPQPRLSFKKGAVEPFTKKIMQKERKKFFDFLKEEKISEDTVYADLDAAQKKIILYGKGKFPGIVGLFKKFERKKYKLHVRVFLRRYQSSVPCHTCHGSRLKPEALWLKIDDKHIFDLTQMPLGRLEKWIEDLKLSKSKRAIAEEALRQIKGRLHFLNHMGLHYLNLHRLTRSLSGGEVQRINLANQLGSELSGTLYVLDEPSIGLHAKDRDQLLDSLRDLVDRGNSVVVVEHDLDTIRTAEHVIEMGPGSGQNGGEILFEGNLNSFQKAKTLTSDFLSGRKKIPTPTNRRKDFKDWVRIQGASENNLKDVNFRFPLGALVGVSGVSGSGKSTLIRHTLHNALARVFDQSPEPIGRFRKIFGVDRLKGISLLDQSSLGRSSRSIPLSVLGAYDEVRNIFAQSPEARSRNLTPGSFSFNIAGGRCETCKGEGLVKTEMYFLDDLYLTCEDCEGKRFKKSWLDIKVRGKNIHDVLQMTVNEAKLFFSQSKSLVAKLQMMEKVGLGYLRLGQSSHSLSGGEIQRLKIATELSNLKRKQYLYILDEPTTGLHISEIELLVKVLQELVDSGNTVIVVEHQLDLLKCVDWLVDLGPGAGEEGGEIVGEGTPEEIAKLKTATGIAMAEVLN